MKKGKVVDELTALTRVASNSSFTARKIAEELRGLREKMKHFTSMNTLIMKK